MEEAQRTEFISHMLRWSEDTFKKDGKLPYSAFFMMKTSALTGDVYSKPRFQSAPPPSFLAGLEEETAKGLYAAALKHFAAATNAIAYAFCSEVWTVTRGSLPPGMSVSDMPDREEVLFIIYEEKDLQKAFISKIHRDGSGVSLGNFDEMHEMRGFAGRFCGVVYEGEIPSYPLKRGVNN